MKGSMKHTEGPWILVPQSQGGDLVAHEFETGKQMNPKGLRVIAFMMSRGDSFKEDTANAALIAAAPDLLEACKLALDELRIDPSQPSEATAIEALKAAIAKATPTA
jgi:hypothetical protein